MHDSTQERYKDVKASLRYNEGEDSGVHLHLSDIVIHTKKTTKLLQYRHKVNVNFKYILALRYWFFDFPLLRLVPVS